MSIINLNGTPSVKRKREVGLLDRHHNNSYRFHIAQVFHCDGLLLCASYKESRFLVWNRLTNQSIWTQFNKRYTGFTYLFLGYNEDRKSCNKSYKVLSFDPISMMSDVVIHDLNSEVSDSCRTIDNDNHPGLPHIGQSLSLKGNTYWFDIDETKMHLGIFLNKFDFSTEKLGRRLLLPYQCREYENLSVSVVREEKLSVSIQRGITSKTEIWVTDQIDETKVVSWSKVLVLDLSRDHQITHFGSFLLDEEKKVVMCYETWYDPEEENKSKEMIYIVGEDSKVTELDLGVDITGRYGQTILNYTPKFGSIEPD